MTTAAVSGVPAYRAPLLQELFSGPINATQLPNMAKMANPADGFLPTRLASGTEVLWVSDPTQLGDAFGPHVQPLWQNGLGLVVYRNEEQHCMGAIFIHGAMKTPWSAYGPDSWHALGGIMAFPGYSFEQAIEMVLGKGYAMTPKWRFIDLSLSAAGHPTLTQLGGGKAILIHGPTFEEKKSGIAVSAEVADALGIYISGPDQNVGEDRLNSIDWSDEFARLATRNFVGSKNAEAKYRGIKPSQHTARGAFRGIKVVLEELVGDRPPIFFQGYGGVGKVMVALAIENGLGISGVSDAVADPLIGIRTSLPNIPLFLDAVATGEQFGLERRREEEAKARQHGIRVVSGLLEALQLAPDTVILSPNAGPHPVTVGVASYLKTSEVRAVVGAANNMLGLDEQGSTDAIAWDLLENGIFVPNDSRINRIGAMACMIDMIGLDRSAGLALQIRQVGEDVRGEINAYRQGTPPQLYSDALAAQEWNRALDEGRAVGGRFPAMNPIG